jgi:hypothetical protein
MAMAPALTTPFFLFFFNIMLILHAVVKQKDKHFFFLDLILATYHMRNWLATCLSKEPQLAWASKHASHLDLVISTFFLSSLILSPSHTFVPRLILALHPSFTLSILSDNAIWSVDVCQPCKSVWWWLQFWLFI